jgi:hypothetical protein
MQNRGRWNFIQTLLLTLIEQRGFWWVLGVGIAAHYGAPIASPALSKLLGSVTLL